MGISSSKRQRRLLVLGAGPAQLGLLRAARDRGLFVVACDRDAQAPGFEYADRRAIVSAEDEPAIGKLAQAEGIDGVIAPGIDWPVAIAARVAARFGLPHPLSPETASLAVSKQRQRERLAESGVPQPAWQIATEAKGLPVPCVVKPPDRQGQKGLTLVRDASELEAAVELAVAESRAGCALVEELVEGPEVTVNAFSVDGVFHPLTVTDRLTADPPAFGVALAHAWPSAHDVSEAVAVAGAAAEVLGIENGPTYTQVR
ncbi:MAG TPA: ATP-grasp domain-containing protein, partial [Gaiellaceae bacterium]|nr:ATP-grasp domain-containing protein [Gaiellaceae bacterium]